MVSTCASSVALRRHAAAATLSEICSGFVAPQITDVTTGLLTSQPIARSSTECPAPLAKSVSV
jgi:hypothetical protein